MTTGRTLFCARCGTGYQCIGDIPARCPACRYITAWSTFPPSGPLAEPLVPWEVTLNDRRLLHSLRIACEDVDPRLGAREG